MAKMTVIQYVLSRLKEQGISDVFGVPGDYVYPVLDAILDDPDIEWRGNCNELNGAYAADGYARTKGLGVFCNTYGSELGAYLALAGAYGEQSPGPHDDGVPVHRRSRRQGRPGTTCSGGTTTTYSTRWQSR